MFISAASVTLEYAQNIINPARVFDVFDIAYNLAGTALGVLVCCALQASMSRPRRRRVDLEIRPSSPDEIDDFVNIHMNDVETTEIV